MPWEGWLTIGAATLATAAIASGSVPPDLALLAALALLLLAGVLPPEEAFAGLAHPATVSVACLLVMAAGVRETGAVDALGARLLGKPGKSETATLRRATGGTALLSAFLNNTPIVAMAVPVVLDWTRRSGASPRRILMPLSFAAVLGGTCTLVGSSTHLLVAALAERHTPGLRFGLFDLAWLGVPATVLGLFYLWVLSPRLLGQAAALRPSAPEGAREYTVRMRVAPGSAVEGLTIEEAGLRHLPGLYLVEVQRGGQVLAAVGPHVRLCAEDRLLFTGIVEGVADLRRIRGLEPEEHGAEGPLAGHPDRHLVEAVVGWGSTLAGRSVRESRFRTLYHAAILAVHRHGERVVSKVGDIVLRHGDVLLLEAPPGFVTRHRHDPAFALLREVEGSRPPRHERAPVALALLLGSVAATALGWLPLLTATLLGAGGMVATRCLRGVQARRALDTRLLLTLGAAMGLGLALERSGAAASLAETLLRPAASLGTVSFYAAVFAIGSLLSSVVTNAAAAAMILPVAATAAEDAGIGIAPVALVVMVATSAAFATPAAYQTHMMVYGPGGYRGRDFLRLGLPLQLLVGVSTVLAAAMRWP